jgi:hypothetical protein
VRGEFNDSILIAYEVTAVLSDEHFLALLDPTLRRTVRARRAASLRSKVSNVASLRKEERERERERARETA